MHDRDCRNAQLTPWPKDLPEWDSLSWDEEKLFIRQADIYGATSPTRTMKLDGWIQAVEDLGELDNTLIIYIGGDNSTSAEGMQNGAPRTSSPRSMALLCRSRTSFSGIRSGDRNGRTRILRQAGRGRSSLLAVEGSARSRRCCGGIDDLEVVGDRGRLGDHCRCRAIFLD